LLETSNLSEISEVFEILVLMGMDDGVLISSGGVCKWHSYMPLGLFLSIWYNHRSLLTKQSGLAWGGFHA